VEVRSQAKTGPQVTTGSAVIEQISAQLQERQARWLEQLRQHPEGFATLEVQVHQTCQQLADQIVAGLLAQASSASQALEAAKKREPKCSRPAPGT
jgi:hypothetical protein